MQEITFHSSSRCSWQSVPMPVFSNGTLAGIRKGIVPYDFQGMWRPTGSEVREEHNSAVPGNSTKNLWLGSTCLWLGNLCSADLHVWEIQSACRSNPGTISKRSAPDFLSCENKQSSPRRRICLGVCFRVSLLCPLLSKFPFPTILFLFDSV